MKLFKFFEFVNNESPIEAKLEELNDLLSNYTNDKLLYSWSEDDDDLMVINFEFGDIPFRYELSNETLVLLRFENNELDNEIKCNSLEEAIDYIEKDIYYIVGLSERKV